MKFGAHISTRAPFSEAINRAKEIDCECMQIFVNPPQRWNPVPIPEDQIVEFNKLNAEKKISPVIIHSIYLINLASDNPFFYEQSIKSLIDDMEKAAKIGALGVNFHVGSTKGKSFSEVAKKVEEGIKRVLANSPKKPLLILENSAGAGNIIGDTLEELGQIIKDVNSPRLKVLVDTAHAFESGYKLNYQGGFEKFIEKFDQLIGLEKLVGFHFNDSKTALNSKRDRHADIGEGDIGIDLFKNIINHPKLKNLFAILETPEDKIPWKKQINLLRSLNP